MNPSADVLALASIEVDVSAIQPGQAIKASWRGKPVFIRNLTAAEQAEANKVPLSELRDPASLADRTAEGRTEEHTSELPSLMRISYAGFCLNNIRAPHHHQTTARRTLHQTTK